MIVRVFRDRTVQGILVAEVSMIAIGSVYYYLVEDWSLLDSVYFCVVALTTVGFGDPAPVTAAGKVFTIFYLIAGVALFALAGTTIVQRSRAWARLEDLDDKSSRQD